MTLEIALTLGILFMAIIVFITEIIRADLAALLVLVILVVVGLVSPEDSISGFANPAVITIWAVFILSAGLTRTGVAAGMGKQVLRLAGRGENRLLAILVTSTAVLSGFMNNIGVAAMFLPVTIDIARRKKISPSLLLMPMAYGSLIGGMLILIGTASNLVVSDFLRDAGIRPLGLFDFTPIGLAILLVSLLYMLFIGKRLLPHRINPSIEGLEPGWDFKKHYELQERMATITIQGDSLLAGKTLAESRFGHALGINILSVIRRSGIIHIPSPDLELQAGDRLLILGRLDTIDALSGQPIIISDQSPDASDLLSEEIRLAELMVSEDSVFKGKTLVELNARQEWGINILAIIHKEQVRRTNLLTVEFATGDRILLQGTKDNLDRFNEYEGFRYLSMSETDSYNLNERLLGIHIPEGSPFAGKSIKNAQLSKTYGITVLSVVRENRKILLPEPDAILQENDLLIVGGRPIDLEVLRSHQTLLVDKNPTLSLKEIETDNLTIIEVMLSPYAAHTGKTLRQLDFREKYSVSVLAIWRGNRPYRTNLADMPLQFGDALLCYGSRDKFDILARDRDFVVLNMAHQEELLYNKAPVSGFIMLGVLAAVILNWLPIYLAAIGGASLMILTRCISIEEAYRSIEWKAVFLIAAMLPMGLAMQSTGVATLIADAVIAAVGFYGPTAILAGIMTLTMAINQFIPSAVNAVVMTPIALATAMSMGISPYPFVMGIAYAVAASFMTPVSHPVNILVMSPGGYRFSDFIRNGLPFSLIVLIISILMLPIIFPY